MLDYFFDDTFSPDYSYRFDGGTVNAVLDKFAAAYDENDDNSVWFTKVKAVAAQTGFAAEMSDYKANPAGYRGSVADVAEILRIAVTGMPNSPDLCTVMKIIGKERTLKRLAAGRV